VKQYLVKVNLYPKLYGIACFLRPPTVCGAFAPAGARGGERPKPDEPPSCAPPFTLTSTVSLGIPRSAHGCVRVRVRVRVKVRVRVCARMAVLPIYTYIHLNTYDSNI